MRNLSSPQDIVSHLRPQRLGDTMHRHLLPYLTGHILHLKFRHVKLMPENFHLEFGHPQFQAENCKRLENKNLEKKYFFLDYIFYNP